MYTFTYFTPII